MNIPHHLPAGPADDVGEFWGQGMPHPYPVHGGPGPEWVGKPFPGYMPGFGFPQEDDVSAGLDHHPGMRMPPPDYPMGHPDAMHMLPHRKFAGHQGDAHLVNAYREPMPPLKMLAELGLPFLQKELSSSPLIVTPEEVRFYTELRNEVLVEKRHQAASLRNVWADLNTQYKFPTRPQPNAL